MSGDTAARTGPSDTPTRRRYTSPLRAEQAAQTRAAVLAAATDLFATKGWAATGMRDVARDAGVAVETVYAGFGSKADLLQAALDVAVVGDDAPAALAERPAFLALAKGSFPARVETAARLVTEINRRTAGLARALREAARVNADLAGRLSANEQRRRQSVRQAVELVAGGPVPQATSDGLWAAVGVEPYLLLVEQGGWDDAQYQRWVADLVGRLLGHPEPVR
jgi:AcrR family transcriptional regulator